MTGRTFLPGGRCRALRRLPVLLAALALLALLAGCRQDPPAGPGDGTAGTGEETPAALLDLIADGASDYVIVRAEEAAAAEVDAAVLLRDEIKDATGVELRIGNDYADEQPHEILVGATNRQASAGVLSGLRYGDYAIAVSGDDVVICGGSPQQTLAAVGRFVQECLPGEASGSWQLSREFGLREITEYALDSVTLCGAELRNYRIVYARAALYGERNEAYRLRDAITGLYGYRLEVVDDREPAGTYEIVIGSANRQLPGDCQTALEQADPNEGVVGFGENQLYLGGGEVYAVRSAVRSFLEQSLSAAVSDGRLEVSQDNRCIPMQSETYTSMSFNLLYSVQAGSERIDRVVELILREMPDTIGVQECSEVWYEALTGRLSQYYGVVGEINDTNWQRWRNAVFYRKDRFRLVETSTQWLSPTPGTMSKLPDTPQYRVLTTAVLEDLQTGARLTHCNTHMSFEEPVREAQFTILMQLVGRIEGPVILTGDFNVTSSSRYYTMIQDAGMHNAMDLTRHQDPANTCGASAIDFCFVREEDINVLTHTVLDEENRNQELSDHCPVLITYTLFPHHQIS